MKGVITSPNFPTNYPPGVECVWNIRSPQGRGLLLLMPNISLPVTPNCADYLTMRESANPLSVVTYHACESYDKPVAFISRSESLYIKFHSSGMQTAAGFRLFYVTFKGKADDSKIFKRSLNDLIFDTLKSGSLRLSLRVQNLCIDLFKDSPLG